MICFKDRAFCSTPGCTCGRSLTAEDFAEACRWWGNDKPPISYMRMCDGVADEKPDAPHDGGPDA